MLFESDVWMLFALNFNLGVNLKLTLKRRSSFQYELDKALETRLRQNALVGVKSALEAALIIVIFDEIQGYP